MNDVVLAGLITALLPKEYQEKLRKSFERFEKDANLLAPASEESKARFCRYMELYWLALHNEQNDYSALQKLSHPEWRKKAENIYVQLQRKVASA